MMFMPVFTGEESVSGLAHGCLWSLSKAMFFLLRKLSGHHPISWYIIPREARELFYQTEPSGFGPSPAGTLAFEKREDERCICRARGLSYSV